MNDTLTNWLFLLPELNLDRLIRENKFYILQNPLYNRVYGRNENNVGQDGMKI